MSHAIDLCRRANHEHLSAHPAALKRGVSRSSRTLAAGCDGRTSPSAMIARTNGVCADGEVVWSWRSNAGAKLVETIPLTTVATKHGHRGEHEGHR